MKKAIGCFTIDQENQRKGNLPVHESFFQSGIGASRLFASKQVRANPPMRFLFLCTVKHQLAWLAKSQDIGVMLQAHVINQFLILEESSFTQ